MRLLNFSQDRPFLQTEYETPRWIDGSGLTNEQMRTEVQKLVQENEGASALTLRAQLLSYVLSHARLSFDEHDVFFDLVDGENLVSEVRDERTKALLDHGLCAKENEERITHLERGEYIGGTDWGHASPDWKALLTLGYTGILERARQKRAGKSHLTPEQADYYTAIERVYSALLALVKRFADTVKQHAHGNERLLQSANTLCALSERAPQSFAEALQLIVFTYRIFSRFEGCYLRSLGGLDSNLFPFYQADLERGVAKETLDEYIKYFYFKFVAQNIFANVPFFIGGQDEDGRCAVNQLSYALVENYISMDIFCPKIHFRLCKGFPRDLILTALHSIRKGNSSFLFINDDVVIPALVKLGEEEKDARNYTVIGCYEPSAEGKEMPCSCNGLINLAKVLELTVSGGKDVRHAKRIDQSENYPYPTFEAFYEEFERRMTQAVEGAMRITTVYERGYPLVTSAPFTSATYSDSIEKGVDVYHGGAKYNNSGLNIVGFATAVDSLCAVKKLVYDTRRISLSALVEALKADWKGQDHVRIYAQNRCAKFGAGDEEADALYQRIYQTLTQLFSNRENGRGGKFRMGLFSIDNCFWLGKLVSATPDGRGESEPISKNLCASQGMDKNGVTAFVQSACKIDFTNAPNGDVLDLILHPSAVAGEDGLQAFASLLDTFVALGGFALHCNVFSKEQLEKAQKEPQKYSTLQVRVCGWNSYFIDLPKEQQDAFIASAKE